MFSKKACYKEFCNDFRTNKYDATKAHQQDLYNDLKSDSLTADLPVVATALARQEISPVMDREKNSYTLRISFFIDREDC